jgi:hypothetical protein
MTMRNLCSRVVASDDRSHDADDVGGRVAASKVHIGKGLKQATYRSKTKFRA